MYNRMTSDRRARAGQGRPAVRDGSFTTKNERVPGTQQLRRPAQSQIVAVQLEPGLRYRLPAATANARVFVRDRDLLLRFESGGCLQLHDLITVETMANAPVLELRERDILASVIGVLALAQGDGATLAKLIKLSADVVAVSGDSHCAALRALMRDGILPRSCFRSRETLLKRTAVSQHRAFHSDSS